MPLVEISEETAQRLREQLGEDAVIELKDLDSFVGKAWFFRTVTYHLIGKVEKRMGNFLVLSNASWVADSGRFTQAIKEGKLNEVEPVGAALINLNSVTDAFPWKHKLPTEQK